MRRLFGHILILLMTVSALISCDRGGRIIPRSKLSYIFAEMFVADAWLQTQGPDVRKKADTTAFYEPIFKSYGYTTKDYIATVEHYLEDPDRFSRIVKKTHEMLSAELDAAQKEKTAYSQMIQRRNRIVDHVFLVYSSLLDEPSFTDRVDIQVDTTGFYLPRRVLGDTLYRGPGMIVRADTLLLQKADSLAVEGLVEQ